MEDVACVDLGSNIVQAGVVAVGDDGLRAALELREVIDHNAPEERAAVLQSGLVDDQRRALGPDALHHALDAALTEVVAARLHRQAVHADDGLVLPRGVPLPVVLVRSGHFQDLPGDEVLPRAVALHDRGHHVLRYVLIVREQLLGILREAVAPVAERRVVVVRAYPRVKAHAPDDGRGVEALDLRVGVQLVEVAHPEREVCVREELDRLGLLKAHVKRRDVLLYGALLQQAGKLAGSALQERKVSYRSDGPVLLLELRAVYQLRYAHYYPAGIEVVVKGLALAKELGGEEKVQPLQALLPVPDVQTAAVAHRDGRLDDHHRVRIDLQHQVDHLLHVRGVEVVPDGVVVGRGRDDHEVRVGVGLPAVQCGGEVQRLLRQVPLYVLVLDGRLPAGEHLHLLRDDVHGGHMMVLGQKRSYAQSHVARAGYRDSVILHRLLNLNCTDQETSRCAFLCLHGFFFMSLYKMIYRKDKNQP